MEPNYLQNFQEPCIPRNHLRNHEGLTFVIPQARTSSYLRSLVHSTNKLWGDLPLDIKSLPILSFSNYMKKHHFKTPNKLSNF